VAYVRTIPPDEATGQAKEIYEADMKRYGYLPNHTQALSLRPAAIIAFRQLIGAIREHQDQRRYELITTFAASRLRCRY
jgi:RNA:NAD 2'-phosphotransferase (TPT1/KptA family)